MIRSLQTAAVVTALALLAACAGRQAAPEDRLVTVEVHNNFAGATLQDISIVGEGTSPQRLGTVAPGATARFEARGLDLSDPHRLVANAVGGGLLRSAPLNLEAGALVVWDLSTNRVHLEER